MRLFSKIKGVFTSSGGTATLEKKDGDKQLVINRLHSARRSFQGKNGYSRIRQNINIIRNVALVNNNSSNSKKWLNVYVKADELISTLDEYLDKKIQETDMRKDVKPLLDELDSLIEQL